MLAGVVLAGGLSSRMGQDKAMLRLPNSQQTLLDAAAQCLRQVASEVWISSDHLPSSVADVYQHCGPLGALHSNLLHVSRHYPKVSELLFLPVDMPSISAEALQYLVEQGRRYNTLVCLNQSYLPLYLPLSADMGAALRTHLQQLLSQRSMGAAKLDTSESKPTTSNKTKQAGLSVRAFFSQFNGREIPFDDSVQLHNVNTPLQWQRFYTHSV